MTMRVVSVNWRRIGLMLLLLLGLVAFCEFIIYYVVLIQCYWPVLDMEAQDFTVADNEKHLKVVLLADTHLLGSREGHWFDKLRREWQMERAFQTTMTLHSPDTVFVLGDLFDEGKWCSDSEFRYYVQRFHKMFRRGSHTDLHVVAGNHDIGFHYMTDKHKRRRFTSAFGARSVRMLRIAGKTFVLVNSMAMEGDHCDMCEEARQKILQISNSLRCAQGNRDVYCKPKSNFTYVRPILLQHFPMYRHSDHNCTGPDAASPREKNIPFKPKYDCLSKDASEMLFTKIKPRLIVSGHTHNFCLRNHKDGTPEWTLSSFSWRNQNNPSFLLMTVSNNNYAIQKCYLPSEPTVVYTYIVGAFLIFVWFCLGLPARMFRAASWKTS